VPGKVILLPLDDLAGLTGRHVQMLQFSQNPLLFTVSEPM
jgi:hypothetical protein